MTKAKTKGNTWVLWSWAVVAGKLSLVNPVYADTDYQSRTNEKNAAKNLTFYVSDQITYDDNLFRLSKDFGNTELLIGPGASRSDEINDAAVGARGKAMLGRQLFSLSGELEAVRFRENDFLNYNASDVNGEWGWVLGNSWSGKLGAEYKRSLADFAYTRSLVKDVLSRQEYYFNFRDRITPRWSLSGEARSSRVDHSASINDTESSKTDSWKGGIVYETPRMDSFGLDYGQSKTRLPDYVVPVGGTPRDYEDKSEIAWLKYAISTKTHIEVRGGHTQRTYDQGAPGDFSGAIGRGTFAWEPTAKTQLNLSVFRELQAYLEIGSEYFVARGASIEAQWFPTQVLTFGITAAQENHAYQGESTPVTGLSRREDNVFSSKLSASYWPRGWLQTDLSYQRLSRSSNRDLQDYDANVVTAGIKLIF